MDSFKKPLCVTGQLHAPWMFSHLDGKRLKDRKTADMRQVRLPLSERTGAGRQSEPRSSLIQSWKTGGLRDIDIAQHTLTTRFTWKLISSECLRLRTEEERVQANVRSELDCRSVFNLTSLFKSWGFSRVRSEEQNSAGFLFSRFYQCDRRQSVTLQTKCVRSSLSGHRNHRNRILFLPLGRSSDRTGSFRPDSSSASLVLGLELI